MFDTDETYAPDMQRLYILDAQCVAAALTAVVLACGLSFGGLALAILTGDKAAATVLALSVFASFLQSVLIYCVIRMDFRIEATGSRNGLLSWHATTAALAATTILILASLGTGLAFLAL